MPKFNQAQLRQVHARLAPIMILPLLLTLITGSLFQIAVLTGKSNDFLWLLEWHTGKFYKINLAVIYPFFNSFGLLILAVTGIKMWLKTRSRK